MTDDRELLAEPQGTPVAYQELAEQCAVYASRIMELEKALGECAGALESVGHPIEWQQRKPSQPVAYVDPRQLMPHAQP